MLSLAVLCLFNVVHLFIYITEYIFFFSYSLHLFSTAAVGLNRAHVITTSSGILPRDGATGGGQGWHRTKRKILRREVV